MAVIKYYKEEKHTDTYNVDCMASFMRAHIDKFVMGYRLYEKDVDITESPARLVEAKELVMMRPANGGLVVYAVIAIAAAVAVVALTPKPEPPPNANRTQSSATNSLGQRSNTPNVGARIDDIWGRVNRHVPRLMQVPHFRFEDNVETEHFALYVSQGKVEIENVRDGDTTFASIPNSKFNAWWPGGNPNNGVAPDLVIGDPINRPLVNVTQSGGLQSSELLPPNEVFIGGDPDWVLTDNGDGTGSIVLANIGSIGIDLNDYFTVGESASLIDVEVSQAAGSITLWYEGNSGPESRNFDLISTLDLSGDYNVVAVSSDSVVVDISTGSWFGLSGVRPIDIYYVLSSGDKTEDAAITLDDYFEDSILTIPVVVTTIEKNPSIGSLTDISIGPIEIPEGTDTISVNLVADNGFYKIINGTEVPVTVNIRTTIAEIDGDGLPTGNETILNNDFTSNNLAITTQSAVTIDIPNPYQLSRISMRRTTDRDKSEGVSNADRVYWRDLYFYENIGTQDYGDVTVAQCVIYSSVSARTIKERQVNMDVTRHIQPYIGNGSFGPEAPVETVAEVVTALALDERNGRLKLSEIDADLFLEVQQQLIDYYGSADFVKVGYDIDSSKVRFEESFRLFWNAVRCNAYAQGAVYRVYPNIARSTSSKQFTHRNKILGTDSRERIYETDNDGIELSYRSNETGAFETLIRHLNGTTSNNRLKIELSGATQEIQAVTRADYELNILKYKKTNISFDADGIGRLTVPGERVDNVDNTRIVKRDNNANTYSIYDGLVVDINGLEVELSQKVFFEDGETHSIRFTNSKGDLLPAIGCTRGATDYHVILDSLPSEPIYTGYKMEKTNFTFASDASRLQMPVIILGTKPKESKSLKVRTLTAINYDERYYSGDQSHGL